MDVLNYYVSLARVDVHLKLCPKHTTSIMTDQGNVNTEQVNNLHEAIKEENKGRIGLLELINRLTDLGNVTADQISILN